MIGVGDLSFPVDCHQFLNSFASIIIVSLVFVIFFFLVFHATVAVLDSVQASMAIRCSFLDSA
jgi:hypothetical protein